MKNINMSIVYMFYEDFIILKIKVALINCSWSKVPSKAVENNGADGLISPTQPPAGSTPARVGHGQTRWRLPLQTTVTGGSWADKVL